MMEHGHGLTGRVLWLRETCSFFFGRLYGELKGGEAERRGPLGGDGAHERFRLFWCQEPGSAVDSVDPDKPIRP